jgi:prolipoprotein diacylglyceryltransferase
LSIFSFLIGFGASIALLRLSLTVVADQRMRWLINGLIVLAAALLGSRLGSVLRHSNYYATRTSEAFNISAGGLWWPGALAAGILAALVIAIIRRAPIGNTMDKFSAMLLPLAVSFWLASWSAGVAYGERLDPSIWWGLPMLDITGVVADRVPVQPAAALTLLLLLGGVEWLWKKKLKAGRRAGMLLLLLSVHTLVFSFMRADPILHWLGLRLDSWVCLFTTLLTSLLLVLAFAVKSKADKIPLKTIKEV